MVVGTVRGDIHDLGTNIVVMLLKGAGYNIVDLGVDVPGKISSPRSKNTGLPWWARVCC
ncbi:MAG TPA: hypothetical protein VMW83_09225 [Spirochaetia bacterium]|nr:hypothetical protein [Spirochaetia bacterium]